MFEASVYLWDLLRSTCLLNKRVPGKGRTNPNHNSEKNVTNVVFNFLNFSIVGKSEFKSAILHI